VARLVWLLPLLLGCSDATPSEEVGSGPQAIPGGASPLYVFLFAHHYGGTGGFYAETDKIQSIGNACIERGITDKCTLFFDGILVQELERKAPDFQDWIRLHRFPVGYHGNDIHGPYPIIVDFSEWTSGRSGEKNRVVQTGDSWDQAVDALRARYSGKLSGYQIGADGYIDRSGSGMRIDDAAQGGISAVRSYIGRDPEIITGSALYQPAAGEALRTLSDFTVYQDSGAFQYKHAKRVPDGDALSAAVEGYLGSETTVFWYMGRLAFKGSVGTVLPRWGDPVAFSGGGGKGGKAGKGGGFLSADAQGSGPMGRSSGKAGKSGKFSGKSGKRGKRGGQGARGAGVQSSGASAGGDALKQTLAGISRKYTQMVSMSIDSTPEEITAALDLLGSTENVQFVTAEGLLELMAEPDVSADPAATAAALLDGWRDGPPDSVTVNETPLSLTDAFQILAGALEGNNSTSASSTLGPIGEPGALVNATGTVTAEQVTAAAAGARAAAASGQLPLNVEVGGKQVGFHQYLHLMAQATGSGRGSAKLDIPRTDHAPQFARWLSDAMRRENAASNFWMECQYWTVKAVDWKQ